MFLPCRPSAANGLWLGLLIFLVSLLPVAAKAFGPVLVQVATVEARVLTPGILLPGTVISRDNALLSTEVAGVITTIRDVGEPLEKGQLVFAIDDSKYQLELAEAKAVLEPLKSDMGFLQRESERLEQLAKENNVARNKLDEMESQYQMARGETGSARARLAQIRDRLRRTRIYAPFRGVISERHKTSGEYAEPGNPILRLVSVHNLEVQAHVPQHTLPWLQDQAAIPVSNGRNVVSLPVRALVPVGNAASHLYELRITAMDMGWHVGQPVRVRVPNAAGQRVLVVPEDALVIRSTGISVYRVTSDNKAEQIAIQTGITDQGYIEVLGEALRAGERIVVRGNERLRPGQDVQIRDVAHAHAESE